MQAMIRARMPVRSRLSFPLETAMTATPSLIEQTGRAEQRRLDRLPLSNCRLLLQGAHPVIDASPSGIRFRPKGRRFSPGQHFVGGIIQGDTLFVDRLPVEVIWTNNEAAGCRIVLDDDARAQATLLALLTSARYRELIEAAPIGIFQSTAQGRYLAANPQLARMYGYASVQELMESVRDIQTQVYVNPGDRNRLRAALAGGPVDGMEFRHLRKDGSVIWVSLSARAVCDHNGEILRYEGFASDVTKHKRDEALRREIELMIQHDLRTPVDNAISIAQRLREDAGMTAEQNELVLLLENSSCHMLDTLDSHLDLYKMETGKYRPLPQPFDCAVLVRELVEALGKRPQFASVRLDLQTDGLPHASECGCPCLGEPKLLRMALQHLLVNALEASPPGATVAVRLSSGADCSLEIRNTGAAPLEVRSRFFEKYVTKGKAGGTGLGTYVAWITTTAQGGDIAMRTSDKDNVTVVTLRLPK
jgi:PAS domain S-box-containing protein